MRTEKAARSNRADVTDEEYQRALAYTRHQSEVSARSLADACSLTIPKALTCVDRLVAEGILGEPRWRRGPRPVLGAAGAEKPAAAAAPRPTPRRGRPKATPPTPRVIPAHPHARLRKCLEDLVVARHLMDGGLARDYVMEAIEELWAQLDRPVH